ncbi:hypothetical protein QQP08_015435, partial [Theobroma cacao]
ARAFFRGLPNFSKPLGPVLDKGDCSFIGLWMRKHRSILGTLIMPIIEAAGFAIDIMSFRWRWMFINTISPDVGCYRVKAQPPW